MKSNPLKKTIAGILLVLALLSVSSSKTFADVSLYDCSATTGFDNVVCTVAASYANQGAYSTVNVVLTTYPGNLASWAQGFANLICDPSQGGLYADACGTLSADGYNYTPPGPSAPTPGSLFGAAVDFSDITADAAYVGYVLIIFYLAWITWKKFSKMIGSACSVANQSPSDAQIKSEVAPLPKKFTEFFDANGNYNRPLAEWEK